MVKKFYPELFAGTPQAALAKQVASRTWEFSDFLVSKLGVTDLDARFPAKVTFHDGCHGLRELGIKERAAGVAGRGPRSGTHRNGRGRDVLRFRRHVCRQISDDFHRDGRGQVRLRHRDRRGLHRLERFELPDAPSRACSAGRAPKSKPSTSPRCSPSNEQLRHKIYARSPRRVTADLRHRQIIRTALHNYETARDLRKAAFRDWQTARQAAAETKWEAINHLNQHLAAFADQIAERGTKVHWASTDRQACDIIIGILREIEAHVPSSSPRR